MHPTSTCRFSVEQSYPALVTASVDTCISCGTCIPRQRRRGGSGAALSAASSEPCWPPKAGRLPSVRSMPAGQPMQVPQAVGSRQLARAVGSGADGRLRAGGRGSRSLSAPFCSRRPRRPASRARGLLSAVGLTRRQSRCARSPTRSQNSSSTSHPCRADHGPTPGLAPAVPLLEQAPSVVAPGSLRRLGLSTASATSGMWPPRQTRIS